LTISGSWVEGDEVVITIHDIYGLILGANTSGVSATLHRNMQGFSTVTLAGTAVDAGLVHMWVRYDGSSNIGVPLSITDRTTSVPNGASISVSAIATSFPDVWRFVHNGGEQFVICAERNIALTVRRNSVAYHSGSRGLADGNFIMPSENVTLTIDIVEVESAPPR
jgi:hypothetical protein